MKSKLLKNLLLYFLSLNTIRKLGCMSCHSHQIIDSYLSDKEAEPEVQTDHFIFGFFSAPNFS